MFELEERPAKELLLSLNGISYVFALFALACAIAWIYYLVEAIDNNAIGGPSGRGKGANEAAANAAPGETRQADTIDAMFQAVVASVLLYAVFRHHFNMSHY